MVMVACVANAKTCFTPNIPVPLLVTFTSSVVSSYIILPINDPLPAFVASISKAILSPVKGQNSSAFGNFKNFT